MILSVIIPSYNEPDIVKVLKGLTNINFDENIIMEIILVDDGSTDNSIKTVELQKTDFPGLTILKHPKNLGKGAAIKTGLRVCNGDIIIIQDADLEYDINDIPKVINPIIYKETLVCYGSRHLNKKWRRTYYFKIKKHKGHSMLAFVGGRLITLLCNILFFVRLTDVLTCYKAFSAVLLKEIELKTNGFEMEIELTDKVLKKTKIKEVPIKYFPRTIEEGKKIKVFDGIKILFYLIKYRIVN